MAVKTKLSFKTVQGDELAIEFAVTDENGDPLILTGKTINWSARNSITKETEVSKSTGDGITILNAPNDHKFVVSLSSTDTADLVGNYDHEAVIIDGVEENRITESDNSFGIITFRAKVT